LSCVGGAVRCTGLACLLVDECPIFPLVCLNVPDKHLRKRQQPNHVQRCMGVSVLPVWMPTTVEMGVLVDGALSAWRLRWAHTALWSLAFVHSSQALYPQAWAYMDAPYGADARSPRSPRSPWCAGVVLLFSSPPGSSALFSPPTSCRAAAPPRFTRRPPAAIPLPPVEPPTSTHV